MGAVRLASRRWCKCCCFAAFRGGGDVSGTLDDRSYISVITPCHVLGDMYLTTCTRQVSRVSPMCRGMSPTCRGRVAVCRAAVAVCRAARRRRGRAAARRAAVAVCREVSRVSRAILCVSKPRHVLGHPSELRRGGLSLCIVINKYSSDDRDRLSGQSLSDRTRWSAVPRDPYRHRRQRVMSDNDTPATGPVSVVCI